MIDVQRVVVIGANGTMGAGSAEVFAAAGCEVALLARSVEKAREGLTGAQALAKSERIADRMSLGTYGEDFDGHIARADLIFEALAEDLALKKTFFERVDRLRRPGAIVATVSSGLSIAEMARGRSESFRRHFLGIHLFNPPNVIVGTEVIPQSDTDPRLAAEAVRALERRFGRIVTVCKDLPAFAGNRIGFKVLNEVARLAARHGVAFADYLVGPYTGRAMPPLATIDLVGWDVHKAIVDNVYRHTRDEAHASFELPGYMGALVEKGHLGNKTPALGGFYRRVKDGSKTITLVLDPATGEYLTPAESKVAPLPFVEKMRGLHRVGRYAEAFEHLLAAGEPEADMVRAVVFGYISYALNRIGEVVEATRDVDRIMGFGFNWAPPGVLVDMMGVRETARAMERCGLEVPEVLRQARPGQRLFAESNVNVGRFFAS